MKSGTNHKAVGIILLLLSFPVSPLLAQGSAPAGPPSAGAGLAGAVRLRPILLRDGFSPEQAAEVEREISSWEKAGGARRSSPQPYAFYPQAGTLWQDLPAPNYVDLDSSWRIRDWECSAYTYNGHDAIDTTIVSFRAQAVGVPVFAALDGVVAVTHDGEDDMSVTPTGSERANYVIIDHGDSQYAQYFHFKKNSVAVTKGQAVVAGQQIGLTGSSGFSTWPHLHFATRFGGSVYEPHAGECREGESGWMEQAPIRRDPYVIDFCFSQSGFDGDKALPWDKATRTGTLPAGDRTLHLEFEGANVPAGGVLRFRLQRPDGSAAMDEAWTSPYPLITFYSISFDYEVSLDPTGAWRLLADIDGWPVIDAPLAVVASASEVVNRPPNSVTPALDPAQPRSGEVVFCRVGGDLYRRDPDYDLVSYHYRWTVNGEVVREVTSAGTADALRRDLVRNGDAIECEVTPTDGTAPGPTATVRAVVGARHARPVSPP